ncbi:MAG TPA: hypothetical protein PLP67_06805 [Methylotenera sp.]|nr:hypothetical protein [Methylotenera sp.]HPM49563.1 hypothetical protein [Methylotenera sp.]
MPTAARHNKTHQALIEFTTWVEYGMKPSIQNVLELKKINPPGLKNPVLLFVVPRAMNYVVERFAVEVVQAWEVLNAELKRQGRRTLGITNKDYRHLKRIRNKLVAHKIENSLASPKHEAWYKRAYGNFESVLALILRVAERVAERIRKLEATGDLWAKSVSTKSVAPFTLADVQALLAAIKAHGIY